jgi:hypothetical protein
MLFVSFVPFVLRDKNQTLASSCVAMVT